MSRSRVGGAQVMATQKGPRSGPAVPLRARHRDAQPRVIADRNGLLKAEGDAYRLTIERGCSQRRGLVKAVVALNSVLPPGLVPNKNHLNQMYNESVGILNLWVQNL
eukprot:TRINITY_DN36111_c0_g1_i4.p2 TRINITY_DN36111_c0_g1~~TRINITY_DN36111_c0_g1_i4.p2  ORF type:complete len:107 (+),score=5.28 TRINITY_DN36111_c0_g1_i4:339-659(+)